MRAKCSAMSRRSAGVRFSEQGGGDALPELGNTASRSRRSASAPGGSAGAWIGADDDESMRALRRAIDLGVNFIDTAWGTATATASSSSAQPCASAREVYVATKIPPKNWSGRPGPASGAEEVFPADWVFACTERASRIWDWRRSTSSSSTSGRTSGWSGRLARRDRAAQERRKDPVLRRLDQRPPAGERDQAHRDGRRRHRAGDLQHLRPESRGRALPGRASGTTSA